MEGCERVLWCFEVGCFEGGSFEGGLSQVVSGTCGKLDGWST